MSDVIERTTPRVQVVAPPTWAEVAVAPETARATSDQSHGGRCAWLSDLQLNMTEPEAVRLYRSIYEITSTDGLAASSTHQIVFDPTYQSLNFHHIRVIRDGITREVDPTQGLELLRRERNLERAIFDGHLTAYVSISDVRVGDLVDVCYSLIGNHPLLGGRFNAEWLLNWQCWVGETRVRLIAPVDRTLAITPWNGAPDPDVKILADGAVLRTWRSQMTAPVVLETLMPPWTRAFASVQLGDSLTWSDVAEVFCDLYEPQPLPHDLEAEVAKISAESEDPAIRTVTALRLVQGSLRYQAVTVGDGGFAPRSLQAIWSSRTADCKDASRLLVAILARLEIAAEPVLVHTAVGRRLASEAPNLTAFNHCVVGANVGDRRYWLDPTLFPQGGDLDTLCQAWFDWGLPLRPGANLEQIACEPLTDSLAVTAVFELPKEIDSPGHAEITTTYFGWRADIVRRQLAAGADNFNQGLLAPYKRAFETATETTALQVHDDLPANRIELIQRLQLGRVWRPMNDGRVMFETPDLYIRTNLPTLSREPRRWPVALGRPLKVASTTEIRVPIAAPPKVWDRKLESCGVCATSKLSAADSTNKVIRLERSLTFERDALLPDEAPAFIKFIDDLTPQTSVAVRTPVRYGSVIEATAIPAKTRRANVQKWLVIWARFVGLMLLVPWMAAVLSSLLR